MIRLSLLVLAGLLAAGLGAAGQARLDAFPVGTTTMVFEVVTEELGEAQSLELVVIAYADGTYTVRMMAEATGTGDELSGFGFLFGGASLAYGGGDVSLSPLQDLMDQRRRLQEGEVYILRGGGTFTDVKAVSIAGVASIEGVYLDPGSPNRRTIVAFGVSKPVYTMPRVRLERQQDGAWETVFSMQLVTYTFAAP